MTKRISTLRPNIKLRSKDNKAISTKIINDRVKIYRFRKYLFYKLSNVTCKQIYVLYVAKISIYL